MSLGKIKRFGTIINNVYIDFSILDDMNRKYYMKKLSDYEQKKIVHVVPVKFWGESPLVDWFIREYSSFGFREILEEKTSQYKEIKRKIGFIGYPDFLVRKEDKWERLEIETFSGNFKTHPSDYSDYLLCYDETTPIKQVKTLTVREYMGCQEIINLHEIPHFLYLYDAEFRKDHDTKIKQKYYSELLD